MRFWGIGILAVGLGMLWASAVQAQQVGFTQEDRERMVRMESTLQVFMEATNQRFIEQREDINQRFIEQREDINQRFAQIDQRFGELRHDMNQRFAQVDQRFEQVMQTLQMIAAIFTAFFLAMLGYAWWDRRTIVRKAKEDTLETLEKTEESRKNALVEQVVAEVIRRLESRKEALSQSAPLPATS